MRIHHLLSLALCIVSCACSGEIKPEGTPSVKLTVDMPRIDAPQEGATYTVKVNSEGDWGVSSNQKEWCTVSPSGGGKGISTVKVTIAGNSGYESRTAGITFRTSTDKVEVPVTQAAKEKDTPSLPDVDGDITVPAGYKLVWHDEFNYTDRDIPSLELWRAEIKDKGWVNNELQYYVNWRYDGYNLAEVSNGTLKIRAKKFSDGKVRSIRMYSNSYWQYGYMEARIKLPKGKGTWPAFWMMPQNYKSWPDDGEIDIMEHVGYHQDYVSSSIHCKAYYHSIGTQKTHEFKLAGATDDFHTYAVEWTAEKMTFIFDGTPHFTFANDNKGDKKTWPFNAPFYVILNLAWGGDWGGAQGVDESVLPATYEIDYVRVFQK